MWSEYYKKTKLRPTSELLKISLEYVNAPRIAYDMGAGSGVDTLYLMQQGWSVIAVDKEKKSIESISKLAGGAANLSLKCLDFESLKMQKSDFIYGRYSFPFCHPKYFQSFWCRMRKSLNPGGILSGVLFGVNDSWASNIKLTFQDHNEIIKLFDGFEILFFDEMSVDGKTALGKSKHWHTYSFILKKGVRCN